MPSFKFRCIKPKATAWLEHEGTWWGDAANNWHLANTDHSVWLRGELKETGFYTDDTGFATFENPEGEQVVSRVFWNGIRRRGGVKPPYRPITIEDIAKTLDWPVEDLCNAEWIGEEETWR